MDAAHRAALLAASCLHPPVHPRTRAPVARYEREPERPAEDRGGQGQGQAGRPPSPPHRVSPASGRRRRCSCWPLLAPGGAEDNLNPEREQSSSVCADSEECIDFSKMCLSNQEYYLKLEELKNAHLETMAKLENMYQTKLHLKGLQALLSMDATHSMNCRPVWDKNNYQFQNLHRSFSEPDLSNSFSSSLSDMSEKDLEENESEDRLLLFPDEQNDSASDRLSLEDYSQRTKNASFKLHTIKKSSKKKQWSPKVTVPKPFQMTIREAKKKQENLKSKSLIELENNLLKKQLEEEAECHKKFRANPVPAYVFVPLYHEIMLENEERRKSLREKRRELLLATQKPFHFIEREAQKKEMRKMQLKDLSSPQKVKIFKAKPVPKFVYHSEINDKLKEEELYREIRIQMRSEELLRNSSLPNSRLGTREPNKCRQKKHTGHCQEVECKAKPKPKVPDFETLHKKFQLQLQRQKNVKPSTVCEPFSLCTATLPSNKEKILEDIQMDEEKLKETRWPYASSRCNPPMTQLSSRSSPSGCKEFITPRITESTRRRLQAIRESAKEKCKVEEEQKRRRARQKQRANELQKLVMIRAEANDPHRSLAQMYKSKLKTFRKHEKQRMKEYLQELEEMEERVEKRPLLLEQVTQRNARMAAEKHYTDMLRGVGLSQEFVSKKGHPAAEMLLEENASNGAEIFGEKDTGSDDENKTDERESQVGEKSQVQSVESGAEEEDATQKEKYTNEEEEEEEGEEEKEDPEEEKGEGAEQDDTDEEEQDEAAQAEGQSDRSDQDAHEYEGENFEEGSVEKSTDSES